MSVRPPIEPAGQRFAAGLAVLLAAAAVQAQSDQAVEPAGVAATAEETSVAETRWRMMPFEDSVTTERIASSALGACFRQPPSYPPDALADDQSGTVFVGFEIGASGGVGAAVLLQSSGFALLDQATLDHITRCIAATADAPGEPLPPGRYALPMEWRIAE